MYDCVKQCVQAWDVCMWQCVTLCAGVGYMIVCDSICHAMSCQAIKIAFLGSNPDKRL